MTTDPLVIVAAVLVGVLGTARLTRLLTHDSYPPSEWVRVGWMNLTRHGQWSTLVTCPFCAAPYIVAASMAWGLLTDLHWSWWLFHGWLAASYAASMVVLRDEPPEVE